MEMCLGGHKEGKECNNWGIAAGKEQLGTRYSDASAAQTLAISVTLLLRDAAGVCQPWVELNDDSRKV